MAPVGCAFTAHHSRPKHSYGAQQMHTLHPPPNRNVPVHRRIRPLFCVLNKPMFDRVQMAIAYRRTVALCITNMMLPKPPLPHSAFASCNMATALVSFRHGSRKPGFDHLPSPCIITVPGGQCPNRMYMIRHHHPCIDIEPALRKRFAHGLSQRINVLYQSVLATRSQIDGEEHRCTGHLGANVAGHICRLPNAS